MKLNVIHILLILYNIIEYSDVFYCL